MAKTDRFSGRVLRRTLPVAQYAAPLLISLNLHRLPRTVRLLPDLPGFRGWLMLWTALILFLAWRTDRGLSRRRDAGPETAVTRGEGPAPRTADGGPRAALNGESLFFLSWTVTGLLILSAAAAAHLYYVWYLSGQPAEEPSGRLPLLLMAAGCVLWIYGRKLPSVPFGSVWGIRTRETLSGPENWEKACGKGSAVCLIAGAACLAAGTFLG